ncbi:NB-ARC domain-containing protein [Sorangium sp. So ce448]|uniref:NB-ARC domain-containing protein n=1 Tax=Sorangium sp. So ce448 TaxID=3133314 RepID=UPI003F5DBC5B
MKPRTTVFISYSHQDEVWKGRLLSHLGALARAGRIDIWSDSRIVAGADRRDEVRRAIQAARVVVLLISADYLASELLQSDELPSLLSRRRHGGIRVLPLIVRPCDWEAAEWLEGMSVRPCGRPLSERPDYESELTAFAQEIRREIAGEPRVDADTRAEHALPVTRPPSTAQPIPTRFVPRPGEFDALRRVVLSEDTMRRVRLISIHGMGGIGKTTLAAALCADESVQSAFPDGIAWATIGREPNGLIEPMKAIGTALGDSPASYPSELLAVGRLRTLLAQRTALVVLDDVWDARHVEPFLVNAPRVKVLFTTRDAGIALGLGATELRLGTMLPDESVALLREGAGREDDSFGTLARRLGHLPLALKIAGACMRDGMSGSAWLSMFKSTKQIKLERRSRRPEENVRISLELSLEQLPPEDRPLYYALGIFPEDVWIPESVVIQVWQALVPSLGVHECRELVIALRRLALLERNPNDSTVRLHDLLRDLAREALGEELPAKHAAFLNAVNPQRVPWHTVADPYLFEHLVYHLRGARRDQEIETLFVDDVWMRGRLRAAGYLWPGYISDLMAAWHEIANPTALREIEAGAPPIALARCFRYALIRTTINSLASNYPPALLSRAVATGVWAPARAVSVMAHIPDALSRLEAFADLVASGSLRPPELDEAVRLGFEAAVAAGNWKVADLRDAWLGSLAGALEGSRRKAVVARGLVLASSLESPFSRVGLLVALSFADEEEACAALAEIELKQVLDRSIPEWEDVLCFLAPVLRGSQVARAFDAALTVRREFTRTLIFEKLAPRLDEGRLELSLHAAGCFESQSNRATVIAAVAARFGDPRRTELLGEALALAGESLVLADMDKGGGWTNALAKLAPLLPENLLSLALEGTLGIDLNKQRGPARHDLGPRHRKIWRLDLGDQKAQALCHLAPYLTRNLLSKATEAARELRDPAAQCMVLSALAKRWQGVEQTAIVEQALSITLGLEDEQARIDAIRDLTLLLTDEMLLRVQNSFHGFPFRLLSALAPRLSGPYLRRALDSVNTAGDEDAYACALNALSRHLEGAHTLRALQAAFDIQDHKDRAQALAALLPNLDDEERMRAVDAALDTTLDGIQDISSQSIETLKRLAPFLSDVQQQRALERIAGFEYWPAQAHALAAIATSLASDMIPACMNFLPRLKRRWGREGVLLGLAPHLSGALLDLGLDTALKHPDVSGSTLAAFAPVLEGKQLNHVIEVAQRVRPAMERAVALAALAVRMPVGAREELVKVAVDALLTSTESVSIHGRVLEILSPLMTNEQRRACFEHILSVLEEPALCESLIALAPHLDTAARERAIEVLWHSEKGVSRIRVLAAFLPFSTDPAAVRREILRSIVDHLRAAAHGDRASLLRFCTEEGVFSPSVLPRDVLSEIARYIIEIRSEWQWT